MRFTPKGRCWDTGTNRHYEPKANKQDTVNPVYNPLRELVGLYVEEVSA